jgi:hypothetical protein
MSPVTLEMLLFLHANYELWSEGTVDVAIRRSNEAVKISVEQTLTLIKKYCNNLLSQIQIINSIAIILDTAQAGANLLYQHHQISKCDHDAEAR